LAVAPKAAATLTAMAMAATPGGRDEPAHNESSGWIRALTRHAILPENRCQVSDIEDQAAGATNPRLLIPDP